MRIGANGISIEVEDQGSTSARPLLLIMGLGMQLIAWPNGFVRALVARGFRAIRFDNRDIGLSQHFDHLGIPNVVFEGIKHSVGMHVKSGYTLADMADDAAGVLDALNLESAHVCGISMGGMIAQHLAARHPRRVRSLTLMMTSSGARHLPGPTMRVRTAMLARPDAGDREAILKYYLRLYRAIGSPGYPSTDSDIRERVGSWIDRSYHPEGNLRQLMAIAADGDRSALLRELRIPTQVIHGRDDALVPLPCGVDLASKIAGATMEVIDGMGHDLPEALWGRLVNGVDQAARKG
jgi:pimeloyl-ACP methyl ester carboxylesterase